MTDPDWSLAHVDEARPTISPTSSSPGENSSLAMHLKPPEVDDVENSINRIEADIDRPIKPFFGNLMQSSTVHHGPCRAIPKP
jgi:hypothetical protein